MEIKLTLKLDKGKKVKLSDSEARKLRNMLNQVYGQPSNYWYTRPYYTYGVKNIEFANSTSDGCNLYNVESTSNSVNLDLDLVNEVLEPHTENNS